MSQDRLVLTDETISSYLRHGADAFDVLDGNSAIAARHDMQVDAVEPDADVDPTPAATHDACACLTIVGE